VTSTTRTIEEAAAVRAATKALDELNERISCLRRDRQEAEQIRRDAESRLRAARVAMANLTDPDAIAHMRQELVPIEEVLTAAGGRVKDIDLAIARREEEASAAREARDRVAARIRQLCAAVEGQSRVVATRQQVVRETQRGLEIAQERLRESELILAGHERELAKLEEGETDA
jgi:hypothetical protein